MEDYQVAHSIDCSDGFGIKILVRRPAEVLERIKNLSDTSINNELTPKEIANTMFTKEGGEILNMLYVQAAELDPATVNKIRATKAEFQKAFDDAGFDVIFMEAIPNEYCGEGSAEALCDPWYIVTTRIGHIKVGWRRRVIVLDWQRTTINNTEELFPDENVTQVPSAIHAYGYEKLTSYLKKLKTESQEKSNQ